MTSLSADNDGTSGANLPYCTATTSAVTIMKDYSKGT